MNTHKDKGKTKIVERAREIKYNFIYSRKCMQPTTAFEPYDEFDNWLDSFISLHIARNEKP